MKKFLALFLLAIFVTGTTATTVFAAEPANTSNVKVQKEGLKDGLKNGTQDGLKYGAKSGAKDGLKYGLKNGLKDGMKNGAVNGTKEGLKNGEQK